ncbi:MAG TPA: 3-oxoadipate enol-lactonase [Beijerinckiaceae bacterium]|jgi:3-oxoadipate enol-lactonase/4-carboxymuconolactone decarboxylase
MPLLEVNGTTLHVEVRGPEDAPAVVFSNSLGATLSMWDRVAPALAGRYRVIRYDTRGHGASPVTPAGFTLETLAEDLAGLLDALGIARAHVVGLSLGGMTAQTLALTHPERVAGLTLMATSSHMPPASAWAERAAAVRAGGMASVADAVLARWFTAAFAEAEPDAFATLRAQFLATPPEGYAGCCEAIATFDLRTRLQAVRAPTLVIAGADDPSTPPAHAEAIRAAIPDAEMVVLPRAAHLLAVERADRVVPHLEAFLARQRVGSNAAPGAATFEAGLESRKSVLGAAHVERSLAKAGAFAQPWQDFITRAAWGEVWGDRRLPWKTRSLVTLAMMVALHREEEFKLHVRPALKNGVSVDELQTLLLQSAIYAGVPAANAAFRWTREVLGDEADGLLQPQSAAE